MISIEEKNIDDFLNRSKDETPFEEFLNEGANDFTIILSEGFEERSVGIIEKMAERKILVEKVVIGRYISQVQEAENAEDLNKKYHPRFEKAAEALSPGKWEIIENANDGLWVADAISMAPTGRFLLDITAISNRGLFNALDSCIHSEKEVFIGYTEAGIYWPKESNWGVIKREIDGEKTLADLIDEKPWLFGINHRVELIPGHEGYDTANSGRAIISFLPFKHARLAAVLAKEDYSDFLFIAGVPRLPENKWRLKAQKEINDPLIQVDSCIEMDTFSYKKALVQLQDILFAEDSLFFRTDIHLCILGSKLQTVACWILSCIIPSITVITSTPKKYFPEAFSEKIGVSWAFPLAKP
jgi:hypothetical protein